MSQTTKLVLVIDDEELVREVIQACLEEIGHWETVLASSGSEGLLIAASEPVDAILLDVSMPKMDGFQTLQKLRASPATQAIPVIFLTAILNSTDTSQFSQLGIAGMIAKPFEPSILIEQIAEILGWEF
jgi:CheY-like chemotaxis protein